VYCDNTTAGRRENGRLQRYVQWQGMSIVETRRPDKATRRGRGTVARCYKLTATVVTFDRSRDGDD